MVLPEQRTRLLRLETALGSGRLIATAFHGEEGISRLFSFTIHAVAQEAVQANDILGRTAVATVTRALGDDQHFHGIVRDFALLGYDSINGLFQYRLGVMPSFWLLAQSSDCRIFQEKSVPDIARQILNEHRIDDVRFALGGNYPQLTFCVQYRETALNFLHRLFEENGIFYFFVHAADRHELVIADSQGAFPAARPARLSYLPPSAERQDDSVSQWSMSSSLQSARVALTDFKPDAPLEILDAELAVSGAPAPTRDLEMFDYPGRYEDRAEGERLLRVRAEQREAEQHRAAVSSNAPGLRAGAVFTLAEHPVAAANRRWLVTGATHEASNNVTSMSAAYSNHIRCLDAEKVPRPPRLTRRPAIEGVQTAIVVGPQGAEIHTDRQGRIKLRFHWDRRAKSRDSDSCWVRVAHSVAGNGWGHAWVPRIGMEVLVEFLDGDPDRPLVTGVVYNGGNLPPHDLPGRATVSGLRTMSTPGGGGFNELSFDDRKGSEQVFLHAQSRLDLRVKEDRRASIDATDHLTVGGDRRIRVAEDDHVAIGGDSFQAVAGALSVQVDEDAQLRFGGDLLMASGAMVGLEARSMLTLRCGGSVVQLTPSGIVIDGPMVLINSGGVAGSRSASPGRPEPPVVAANSRAGEATRARGTSQLAARSAQRSNTRQSEAIRQAAVNGTPFCEFCQ